MRKERLRTTVLDIWTVKVRMCIALGYRLDYQGSRIQFPVGAGYFSLHHHVQNSSGTNPASYPVGTRGSFPGGKVARA
jgi:hypothetical protein